MKVRVLVVDDLHFLRPRNRSATEISNHFKYIANEFPVTLLFVGVGLAERGLFGEIDSDGDESLAQTGRRTTALTLNPFLIDTDEHRHHWRSLLLGDRAAAGARGQASRHARRPPAGLPVRPLHRAYRLAHDT